MQPLNKRFRDKFRRIGQKMHPETNKSVLDALKKIGKPCKKEDLYAEWRKTVDIEVLRKNECFMLNMSDDYQQVMTYHGVISELFKTDVIYATFQTGTEGYLICLDEWKKKRYRCVDDDWLS